VLEVVVADVEVHVARRHALEVSVAPARKDLEPDVAALREVAAGDVDQRGAAEISDLDFFLIKKYSGGVAQWHRIRLRNKNYRFESRNLECHTCKPKE
jgi:hypothetical protein